MALLNIAGQWHKVNPGFDSRLQVFGNQDARVAELADALDSGSSE